MNSGQKSFTDGYRFFDREVCLFPARDLIFYNADIHSNLITRQRIQVMKALLERKELTVITTMGGCMDHLLPLEEFERRIIRLKNDSSLDLEEMKGRLVEMGYERTGQVEGSGQFAIRGGILDIFPLTEESPVPGGVVGMMRWIPSAASICAGQRSVENLDDDRTIYPACEVLADPRAGSKRGMANGWKQEADRADRRDLEESRESWRKQGRRAPSCPGADQRQPGSSETGCSTGVDGLRGLFV